MNRLKILIFVLFVGIFYFGFSNNINQQINLSNKYFKEKQYEKAANILTGLLDQKIYNSTVYYNLGNCFYQLKEYPKAILFYEKANKLDRNNSNIQHNLKLANNKALTKIETSKQFFLIQWLNAFIYQYNLKTWSIVLLIVIWSFAIFSILFFRTKRTSFIFFAFGSFVIALMLFFICYKNYIYQTKQTHAIVMQSGDTYPSPNKHKKYKNGLEEGSKIKLLDNDGGFYKVQTSNDNVVWILKSQVAEF
ncbi:MAG: tetratricopeptide repeat protein [Chitinophagales bacterium]|nr:tetratricopeptide repeat protein [Chitinophagales bacterium]